MEEFKGRAFNTFVYAEIQSNGGWRVDYKIVHKRTIDLINWEKRDVVITSFDNDIDKAIANALTTVLQYLNAVDFDLFSDEGLDSSKLVN